MKRILWFCLSLLLFPALHAKPFDSADANARSGPLEIQRITPAGKDVETERQIVFQFNRPVVPVGRMERAAAEIPITIVPALKCQWRWLNTSALACELNEADALTPATRYRIAVQPGIKAEDGQTLAAPVAHEFITQRPAISYDNFNYWLHPGLPLLRLSFNQAVSRESVESHLYMLLPEQGSRRVPLRAVAPPEDDYSGESSWVLHMAKGELWPLWVKRGGDPLAALQEKSEPEFSDVWLVLPRTFIAEDNQIQLIVERGIKSQLGPEQGVENRTVREFHSLPAFRFLGISCQDNQDEELFFRATPKPSTKKRCDPLANAALVFSAPVIASEIHTDLRFLPDLAGGRKDYNPWKKANNYTHLDEVHKRGKTYSVHVPELLKAYQDYRFTIAKPGNIKDEFGRPLKGAVDMAFATDHRRPAYSFEHEFAVLEKGVDSEVPVVVTNLNSINLDFTRMNGTGVKSGTQQLKIPKVEDVAFRIPMKMRDLIGAESGVVQGTFSPEPAANNRNYSDNWFFAQVTPFHVQVKLGHFNTLVWVTDFATGQPVAGVKISVYPSTYSELKGGEVRATGETNADGVAMLDGVEKLDPKLELLGNYGKDDPRLFVRCEKGADMALLALDYQFNAGTPSEDYLYNYTRPQYGHIHTWGTTAQGVYKVGDTVQYKLFVRNQDNQRFVLPPLDSYTLTITDPMSKVVHEVKDFKLSEFGGLGGEFTIPKTAAVGWYYVSLKANFTDREWQPFRVLVSDFTPSPFRVTTEFNGTAFRPGDDVTVTALAKLHAGGPYAEAESRLTVMLDQEPFVSENPKAQGFQFDTYNDDFYEEGVHEADGKTDNNGEVKASFTLPEDARVLYGKLMLEGVVRDDRGKSVAARNRVQYIGRDRFVGLKPTAWVLAQNQPATVQYLVVDAQGNPAADSEVTVAVERRETKAARVKGAGNAYLTQYNHEWVAAAQCGGKSSQEVLDCSFTPDQSGYYRITATVKDSQSREQKTELYQWVTGSSYTLWDDSNSNYLQVTAEKKAYQVGDTARYLVQNPFPGAKALVTVERYGVMESRVTTLQNSLEIIEVPITADHIPGFFVSVMVVSPRVDKPLGDNLVDLGKPAFRLGYVQTEVDDPYKQLTVNIATDKPVYRPRETVTVDLQAQARRPEGFNEPIELTVAVLDESVFDLISGGKSYFDPYAGFYTLDDLDVANYNLLLKLVGRQKFEKKGANPGGDGGGNLAMRSLFKFVSYWNPNLKTDAEGKAQVSFEVPDNLTGWRVLAMAMTPNDRMGLSDANFKVNQPLELRPVMPNQVTSGDTFSSGFSVMNRTEKTAKVSVSVHAAGPVEGGQLNEKQELTLEPFKRHTIWLPMKTTGAGDISFTAQASDGENSDGLEHTITVRKQRSLVTGATYGTTVSAEVSENVLIPAGVHTDAGGVSVSLAPSIISNVDGAFEYMRDYPYQCWEQKLSKGVMASHYGSLKDWLNLEWTHSAELPALTLQQAVDFQAPNGGMSYFVPTDDRVSPYLSAYTALAFNWLRKAGQPVPDMVEDKLHNYLYELLRKDALPDYYNPGMSATVRAVALAALAQHGKISRDDILRYGPHVPRMSLFGKAHYLNAALHVAGTEKQRQETANAILAKAIETGGKISFNETLDDAYSRILTTPLRDNCAVLSALSLFAETPQAKGVEQLPMKLVRTIIAQRKSRTHWENTQENLFCMNALIEYSRVYEKDTPKLDIKVNVDGKDVANAAFSSVKDSPTSVDVAMENIAGVGEQERKLPVKLARNGTGRLYYGVRLSYAPTIAAAEAINHGIEVQREYHVERGGKWLKLESPMEIASGELVRVDLYLSLPTARNFVVVDDPVPGGLEPVNRDLATSSELDADKAGGEYAGGSIWFSHNDWNDYGFSYWSFYHKELRHHAAIFYSDWLDAGNYHLSYTAQAIAPGEFTVMPTHAEEMYEPDVYGKAIPAVLKVNRAE